MKIFLNPFHHAESLFFSLISFKQQMGDNLVAYASGVGASGLNPAILQKDDKNTLEKDLIDCEHFYSKYHLPWALVVPESLLSNVRGIIEKQMHLVDKGKAMVLLLGEEQIPSSMTSLMIKQIDEELEIWSIPLLHGFESTPERTAVYTQRHKDALQKTNALYHFSAFMQDEVLCSLTVSLFEHYARIDDVATMPSHQRKGYATALIYAVLAFLKERHVQACFLEASTEGLGIYQKIGFKPLFTNYYFEPLTQ